MAFATDRDLLFIEPNLFRDVAWLGQRLLKGTGDVVGTTLTLVTFDHDLVSAGVGEGSVVLIAGIAHEVLSVADATHAQVSKIRGRSDDPAIPADAGTGLEIVVSTLRPQIELVHREVLRLAGIDAASGSPTEADVTNGLSLVPLETFGALHLAYAAAGALSGVDSHLAARAAMYASLVGRERTRARVEIDLDADGLPDATRRLNVVRPLRV